MSEAVKLYKECIKNLETHTKTLERDIVKEYVINNIVCTIQDLHLNSETILEILEKVEMEEQVYKQLSNKYNW